MHMCAGFGSSLLCQKIDHIELLEGCEDGDNNSRRNDGTNGWNRNITGALHPSATIKQSAIKVTLVYALNSAIHNHNHKRQRQPKIDSRAADKRRHIRG